MAHIYFTTFLPLYTIGKNRAKGATAVLHIQFTASSSFSNGSQNVTNVLPTPNCSHSFNFSAISSRHSHTNVDHTPSPPDALISLCASRINSSSAYTFNSSAYSTALRNKRRELPTPTTTRGATSGAGAQSPSCTCTCFPSNVTLSPFHTLCK